MNDKTDEIMKTYFSKRKSPSPEAKAVLHKKLLIAAQSQEKKWNWLVILYAIFFSAAIICVLWIFTANSLIVFISATYFLISMISILIITIVCQTRRTKGGIVNGFIFN